MSRRVSLPGADELFRATAAVSGEPEEGWRRPAAGAAPAGLQAVPDYPAPATGPSPTAAPPSPRDPAAVELPARREHRPVRSRRAAPDRRPTGRERHEEKITVYVSPEELVDLEQARLTLRAEHGLAIDRGRIVREALAVVLADLDAKAESSILVRRLRDQ